MLDFHQLPLCSIWDCHQSRALHYLTDGVFDPTAEADLSPSLMLNLAGTRVSYHYCLNHISKHAWTHNNYALIMTFEVRAPKLVLCLRLNLLVKLKQQNRFLFLLKYLTHSGKKFSFLYLSSCQLCRGTAWFLQLPSLLNDCNWAENSLLWAGNRKSCMLLMLCLCQ